MILNPFPLLPHHSPQMRLQWSQDINVELLKLDARIKYPLFNRTDFSEQFYELCKLSYVLPR
jgi:hypothetical protein